MRLAYRILALLALGAPVGCSAGRPLTPWLSGGLWHGTSRPTARTAAPKSTKPCSAAGAIYEAASWHGRRPPQGRWGDNTLEFVRTVFERSCWPDLSPLAVDDAMANRGQGITPGSVVFMGFGQRRLVALVEGCDPDGTCLLWASLPDGVRSLRLNLAQPDRHRDNTGKVVNSVLSFPASQGGLATTAEVVTEIYAVRNGAQLHVPPDRTVALQGN